MRVVPHPSHTRRMAHLYRLGSLAALLLLIASLAAALSTSVPAFAFLAAFCALALSVTTRRGAPWQAGLDGERQALRALRGLPDGYTVVTGFVAPGTRQGDVDLLVVGPMGVVVVEVKAYRGTILHENGAWWRVRTGGRKTPIKNASAQARASLRAVEGFLARKKSCLPALAGVYVPATAVLVFVGADRVNAVGLDMPALRAEELAGHIRALPPRLTTAQAADVAALFGTPRH